MGRYELLAGEIGAFELVLGSAGGKRRQGRGLDRGAQFKADKPLQTPVTMVAIKADKRLAEMALVKYSRLSVQPVTADEWKIVCKMGGV